MREVYENYMGISHSEDLDGAVSGILIQMMDEDPSTSDDLFVTRNCDGVNFVEVRAVKNGVIEKLIQDYIEGIAFRVEHMSSEDLELYKNYTVYVADLGVTLEIVENINKIIDDAFSSETLPSNFSFNVVVLDHHLSTRALYKDAIGTRLETPIPNGERYYGHIDIVTPEAFDDFEEIVGEMSAAYVCLEYARWYRYVTEYNDKVDYLVNSASRYDTYEWRRNPGPNRLNTGYPREFLFHCIFRALGLEEFIKRYLEILRDTSFYDDGTYEALDNKEPWESIEKEPIILNLLIPSDILEILRNEIKNVNGYIDGIVKAARIIRINEYHVAMVISHDLRYFSLAANEILEKNPSVDLMISCNAATRTFSVRAYRDDLNCDRFANYISGGNGGGHAKAAGGRFEGPVVLKLLQDYWDVFDSNDPASKVAPVHEKPAD